MYYLASASDLTTTIKGLAQVLHPPGKANDNGNTSGGDITHADLDNFDDLDYGTGLESSSWNINNPHDQYTQSSHASTTSNTEFLVKIIYLGTETHFYNRPDVRAVWMPEPVVAGVNDGAAHAQERNMKSYAASAFETEAFMDRVRFQFMEEPKGTRHERGERGEREADGNQSKEVPSAIEKMTFLLYDNNDEMIQSARSINQKSNLTGYEAEQQRVHTQKRHIVIIWNLLSWMNKRGSVMIRPGKDAQDREIYRPLWNAQSIDSTFALIRNSPMAQHATILLGEDYPYGLAEESQDAIKMEMEKWEDEALEVAMKEFQKNAAETTDQGTRYYLERMNKRNETKASEEEEEEEEKEKEKKEEKGSLNKENVDFTLDPFGPSSAQTTTVKYPRPVGLDPLLEREKRYHVSRKNAIINSRIDLIPIPALKYLQYKRLILQFDHGLSKQVVPTTPLGCVVKQWFRLRKSVLDLF